MCLNEADDLHRDIDYPDWLSRLEHWLREVHKHLHEVSLVVATEFFLANDGAVPAQNLLLRVEVPEDYLILPPASEDCEDKDMEVPPPPAAPMPPKGRWVLSRPFRDTMAAVVGAQHRRYPELMSFGRLSSNISRDSYSFYWRPHEPVTESRAWEFECAEFRHRGEPESFELKIRVDRGVSHPRNGAIEVAASAANLPDPVRAYIPIVVTSVQGDTAKCARVILGQYLDPKTADSDPVSEH